MYINIFVIGSEYWPPKKRISGASLGTSIWTKSLVLFKDVFRTLQIISANYSNAILIDFF